MVPLVTAPVVAVAASPKPKPKQIGRVVAHGRSVNLVGKAQAASVGTIDREQIGRARSCARRRFSRRFQAC